MPVRRESLTELHNRGRLAVVMVGKQIFDGDRRSEGLSEGAAALFSVTPRCVPKRSKWWLYACICVLTLLIVAYGRMRRCQACATLRSHTERSATFARGRSCTQMRAALRDLEIYITESAAELATWQRHHEVMVAKAALGVLPRVAADLRVQCFR